MQKLMTFLNVKRMWQNTKIGQRYMISLIVSFLLFAASMVNAYFIVLNIRQDMNTVEDANNKYSEISEAITLLNEINVLSYHYMTFARSDIKETYNAKMQELTALTDRLAAQLDPSTELGAGIRLAQSRIADFDGVFKERLVFAVERNLRDQFAFIRLDMTDHFEQGMDALQQIQSLYDGSRGEAVTSTYGNLNQAKNQQLILFIISLVIGIAVVMLISVGISRQMKKLVSVSDRIADGDLTVRSDIAASRSEIGRLSDSVNRMADRLHDMIRTIADMSAKVEDQSNKLLQASADMEASSSQIADTMNQLAAGTEEQAGSASEITHVLHDLNGLIIEAGRENDHLLGLSDKMLDIAGKGNRLMQDSMVKMNEINTIMRESVERMHQLERRLQDISGLVEVVGNIAAQTNLLALNASIEAARAGDAGRGFAVVATEVRKLANQVSESLVSITAIVENILKESRSVAEALESGYGRVDEGSGMIRLTGDTLNEIHEAARRVSEGIGRMNEHLVTITKSSEEINKSAENIAAVSEQTAAGVEEVSSSVQNQHGIVELVNANARDMSGMTGQLKQLVAAFKI